MSLLHSFTSPRALSTSMLFVLVLLCWPMISLAETTAEPSEKGAIVKVDGDFFCEYVSLFRHMPCIWPIHGPTNQPMTRAWPLAERGEHEEIDHPHHHSFWFTHERVNGRNFWLEPDSGHPSADSNIVMKQTDLEIVSASGEEAVIRTTNDWMADGEVVVSDVRTLTFSGDSDQRSIDFAITLKAPESHEVKFADIKDGTFSIRVAGTMKPTARMGGKIVNSEGQVDDDAWGQVAKWIDCSGPVVDEAGNSETVGVTLLSHPSNVRHPTRWHARTYGLITAAPFGEQPFPNPRQGLGGYTIPAGGELKLRYKAIFHRGALDEATAAEEYEAFAADGE